jgi:hypothetical protein
MKARTEAISARIDSSVLAEIEAAAEEERRSRSNVVRCVLEDWAAGRMKRLAPAGEIAVGA